MASLSISPSRSLQGELSLPGDKSISHRALLVGSIAQGVTRIAHCLDSGDLAATRKALAALGVMIRQEGQVLQVEGLGREGFQSPAGPLDMGNSGTTTRLLLGLAAGQPITATFTGDPSLSSRPMGRVTQPLSQMGARFEGPHGLDRLPLTLHGGKLHGIRYTPPVSSAQVKSALLLAGLCAQGSTTVLETIATRDHTERILKRFGARLKQAGPQITVESGGSLRGQDLEIPGDFSSAAFFLVAALVVPGSSITLRRIGLNPTRTGLLEVLKQMGAQWEVSRLSGEDWEPVGDLRVRSSPLKGVRLGPQIIPRLIDELPILMVAATQAQGTTVMEGAGELKFKETDRIHSMVTGLSQMGARIRSEGETIRIEGPTPLKGARVASFGDHRTAMALSIAGLAAQGTTTIEESQWIQISFPGFEQALAAIRR